MRAFAEWLAATPPSVFIQNHNSWAIPTIQSIHIVGIAMVLGSALMITLRLLGWAGMDQTLRQTTERFGPWLIGSLWLMLATGILMVIGEPVRELITFSFWLKMFLVAAATMIAVIFRKRIGQGESQWRVAPGSVRWLAMFTFLIWMFIIVLGRLIAYDHVWGSWSPSPRS